MSSLRFRILLIILIIGIVPLVILEITFMNVTEDTVIKTRSQNVSARYSMLANYLANSSDGLELNDASLNSLVNDMAGIFTSRIQIIDKNFNIINDTYQINKGKICVSQDVNKCFNGTNSSYPDKDNKCIIVTQAIKNVNTDEIDYVIFATDSISDIIQSMQAIRVFGVAIMIMLIIVIIAFAIFASFKLVKPFRNIDDTIEKIGQSGDTSAQIELKGCSELAAISDSFNNMMSHINQMEASRQEFVSNVSHELKTPMTSIKVLADSLMQSEGAPAELYREFLGDIINEIDRENQIISDLLTLVRIDNANVKLNISQVNINDVLDKTMKIVRPLAEKKNIELVLETYRPIIAEVDETKLSMAVMNLVENGVKYNNVDGWVHVSVNADQTYFYIKIQDGGYGIPLESVDHIFERFYRVDKARDRDTGGTGLGLAITKSITVAHHGTIKVYSEEGVGTTFNMQIPLTYVPGNNE